ncbi:MAG: gliding motility-associated protein GldE [Chitinophagales bacterium]|nr:gliding motility-associated protein GldE [Chitinophagales bacterium]
MESDSCPDGDPEQYILFYIINLLTSGMSSGVMSAIFSVFGLLCASAMISASEAAFYSLRPGEIDDLKTDETPKAKRVISLLENRDYLLSTILITNNLINVAIVVTSHFIFISLLNFKDVPIGSFMLPGEVITFVINVLVVTGLIVLAGELAPKVYAQQNRIGLVRFMSGPIVFLKRFFYIPNRMINYPVRLIEKSLGTSQDEITIDELNKAIDLTAKNEVFKDDVELLKGIVHFGNTTVKQIMRSRVDIEAFAIDIGFQELLDKIRSSGYSRFPIYEGDLDNITGILYVKDLLRYLDREEDFKWQELMREAIFIPETKKIDDLLKEIQVSRKHLAIVADEYGGTSGIVTLEDIVEEVLGEIKDEFDDLVEMSFRKIDDNNYIFEGKSLLNDVCKIMEINNDTFDEVKGDADSLAGLLLELAGYFPKENEEIVYGKFKFVVLNVGYNRIEKVKITRNKHAEENI